HEVAVLSASAHLSDEDGADDVLGMIQERKEDLQQNCRSHAGYHWPPADADEPGKTAPQREITKRGDEHINDLQDQTYRRERQAGYGKSHRPIFRRSKHAENECNDRDDLQREVDDSADANHDQESSYHPLRHRIDADKEQQQSQHHHARVTDQQAARNPVEHEPELDHAPVPPFAALPAIVVVVIIVA